MKQWLAILAVVGFLASPVMVGAESEDQDETRIPREANWTSTPSTPAVIAVPQKRVVTTEQEQATDIARPAARQPSRSHFYLTEEDAKYQAVNDTTRE